MRSAVVTGAASGIGQALARQLAGEKYLVHLADISSTVDLAAEIGGVPERTDVSSPEQMLALAADVPAPDIVCLNAGIVGPSVGNPWEVPADEWSAVVGVNVLGVVNGLRAFVPRLISSGRTAHIIITASLAGLVTFPGGGAYAATKHAVVAIAEQAALALQDTPVGVTLLCPALVRTAMSEIGEEPGDVAATALAAARAGQFLVLPQEWRAAVEGRARHLLTGTAPRLPEIQGSPDQREAAMSPRVSGLPAQASSKLHW